jgi:hypothetical protein
MFAVAALWALAAPLPPAGQAERVQSRVEVFARIVAAAEVREGQTDVPHQRRQGLSPEQTPLTLIEFE